MNAIFRHMAFRLWLTALAGGMGSLAVLPWWQRTAGIDWLPLGVALSMTLTFVLIGWLMNRAGSGLIERQIKEAGVWERAGMPQEAAAAFEKAAALFDSFWLSPLKRRQRSPWLTAQIVRFYLSQPSPGEVAEMIILDYLRHHPDDQEAAETWLEHILKHEQHSATVQETASRIGAANVGNTRLQALLVRLFLADRRADFEALRIYRLAWQNRLFTEKRLLVSLAQLLLNEGWLNDWILQVYLEAYRQGMNDCLEGIVAAVRWLPPNSGNASDLDAARAICTGMDASQREAMSRRFQPKGRPQDSQEEPEQPHVPLSVRMGRAIKEGGETLIFLLTAVAGLVIGAVRLCRNSWTKSLGFRKTIAITSLCAGMVLVAAVGMRVFKHTQPAAPALSPEPTTQAIPPAAAPDPFTIQVAAYLKPEDAKSFVEKLRTKQLDAFWTVATSADRKWYQVKVSHFATREIAQQYGEALKAKGVIDDFYVSNYQAPESEP